MSGVSAFCEPGPCPAARRGLHIPGRAGPTLSRCELSRPIWHSASGNITGCLFSVLVNHKCGSGFCVCGLACKHPADGTQAFNVSESPTRRQGPLDSVAARTGRPALAISRPVSTVPFGPMAVARLWLISGSGPLREGSIIGAIPGHPANANGWTGLGMGTHRGSSRWTNRACEERLIAQYGSAFSSKGR